MKKVSLLIIFLFIFSYMNHAFADDVNPTSDPNWGVKPKNENAAQADESNQSEEEWNKIYDQMMYNKYGSDESPAFLNREKMNPSESEYGYDGN